MLPEERKQRIVELVTARDGCRVEELTAEEFSGIDLVVTDGTVPVELREVFETDGVIIAQEASGGRPTKN